MLQYMLDTNICIYVIKNYPPKLRAFQSTRRATLHIERYARGAALRAEKSARRSENLQAIGQFCARLEVLAFPAKAAAHFGQIRADVERLGKPVGPLDMLIGAHARGGIDRRYQQSTRIPAAAGGSRRELGGRRRRLKVTLPRAVPWRIAS